MRRFFVAVPALALLAACASPPGHERPQVDVPGAFRGPGGAPPAAPGPTAATVADAPWWGLFRDPVLEDLVKQAIAGNEDLRAAAARVDQAQGVLGSARSDEVPHLDATGSLDARRDPATRGISGRRTIHDAYLSVPAYEVDAFGRVRSLSAAACADYLAAEEARRALEIGVVAEVAIAWFELRETDEELAVTRAALKTREEGLRVVAAREQGGIASGLDSAQAEAERAATASRIPDLERRVASVEHRISFLLGRPPRAIARGDAATGRALPPEVPAGLPSALLERRPDVLEAEHRLEAEEMRVGAARAAFFPQITLTALLGFEGTSLENLFQASSHRWSFAPAIVAPLFDAGRRRGDLAAAEGRREEAVALYRKAVQQSFREVSDALFAWRKAVEANVENEKFVTAAQRAADLARTRYEGGLSSYLEVLDPQRRLLDAQIDLARTRFVHLAAAVSLYRALGGGWPSPAEPPRAAGQ